MEANWLIPIIRGQDLAACVFSFAARQQRFRRENAPNQLSTGHWDDSGDWNIYQVVVFSPDLLSLYAASDVRGDNTVFQDMSSDDFGRERSRFLPEMAVLFG
jgi:hypothetical protein